MLAFSSQIRIEWPRDKVWQYLTDLSNATKWLKGLLSIEPLSPGPAKQGKRFVARRAIMGGEREIKIEITQWQPPERFALRSSDMGVTATYAYTLDAAGDTTDVTLEATCETGSLATLMSPMIRRAMRKHDGDQLERLKAAIEKS